MHDGQIYLPVVDMNYQMASPDQQLAQLDPACQDQRQLYYDNNTQQLLQAVPIQCLDAADQQLFDQHQLEQQVAMEVDNRHVSVRMDPKNLQQEGMIQQQVI